MAADSLNVQFQFPGFFQVWSYTVEHRQLLLRSTKSKSRATQIDVLFKNVAAMQLATTGYNDLRIIKVLPALLPELGALIGDNYNFYRLSGMNEGGLVVAGTVVFNESDQEYFDSSPLLAGGLP